MTLKVDSVYVAASSSDIERAQHWTDQLRVAGITVTSGWIEMIASNEGVGNPRNVERAVRARYSRHNAEAIDKASLLWCLVPPVDVVTYGAWWESGYAFKGGKLIVASGIDTERSVFNALAHEFRDDITAFASICRYAREGVHAP